MRRPEVSRHRLDLLPLLDVFMVVLFVFATIQEQRLDDSTRDAEALEQRVQQAEARLAAEQARQHDQARDRAELHVADEAERRKQASAAAEAAREAQRLRIELDRLRLAVAEHQQQTREGLERLGLPDDTLERIEVLTRVLDKYSVIEVEIIGRWSEDGIVVHDCCFRSDPLADRWSSCGIVPQRFEERGRWLDEGADGLGDALRRTKGGNAMTVVRQDDAAAHRIASRLVEQLRERFSDQHFYVEEQAVLHDHCAG